ncbi:hypothetical protein FRC01_001351 [Tulasnella sp. 417]|nr:hypothetical protein FRC01_001351 [Tulasnella sp. 417]
MKPYICWVRTDSFYIPDIEIFVESAQPVYFPGQKDGWDSFWKQLRIYQFEKQACDSGGYTFTHANKKFTKDGKYLHEVVPKPKQQTASTSRVAAQAPPPGLYASDLPSIAPLSPSQVALHARLSQLEVTILELKEGLVRQAAREDPPLAKEKRLLIKEKRLLTREKRLSAREKRLSAREKRLSAREKRLSAREKRLAKEKRLEATEGSLLPRESRLLEEESQPMEVSEDEPAIPLEGDTPCSVDPRGSVGAAVDAEDRIAPPPQTDTSRGGNVQEGSLSHPVTRTMLDTARLARSIELPTTLQPSDFPLPTDSRPSSPYISGDPTIQELLQGSSASDDPAGSFLNNFGAFREPWWRDHPASTQTNQASAFAQTSSAHGSGDGFQQTHLSYGSIENGPNPMVQDHLGQHQNVGPPFDAQNSASTSAAAFADQVWVDSRNSNSPRASSGRLLYGGSQPVPLPQPRSPSWFW